MKRTITLIVLGCIFALSVSAFDGYSKLVSVEPETGKVGDEATAKGENLDKASIAEIYLTNGTKDMKAEITSQSGEEIKFKIPQATAGRYHLMILTANKASMIEQPVVLTVE